MNDAMAPTGQRGVMKNLRLTGQAKKPAPPRRPRDIPRGRRTRKTRVELDESDPRKAAWEAKTSQYHHHLVLCND